MRMITELEKARKEIDRIDERMARLFEERMMLCAKIAEYKLRNGLPILDASREEQVIGKNVGFIEADGLKAYYKDFIKAVMSISRLYQQEMTGGKRSQQAKEKYQDE